MSIEKHQIEMRSNQVAWPQRLALKKGYGQFYGLICRALGSVLARGRLLMFVTRFGGMDEHVTKFASLCANKGFIVFYWLLHRAIKEALCGGKVLLREDHERIDRGQTSFEDFDPLGDFELSFGANSGVTIQKCRVPSLQLGN
jgi:hypothetical protein